MSSNLTSITELQSFAIIFQNIEMTDTSIKLLNNRIIDQLKTKFEIIDVEKPRTYLRPLLTKATIERKIDLFVISVRKIETKRIRSNFEQQAALSLKKDSNLKFRKFISKIFKHFLIIIFENVLINLILNQFFIKSTKGKFCLHRNIYFMQFSMIDINIEKMSISMRILKTITCRF